MVACGKLSKMRLAITRAVLRTIGRALRGQLHRDPAGERIIVQTVFAQFLCGESRTRRLEYGLYAIATAFVHVAIENGRVRRKIV